MSNCVRKPSHKVDEALSLDKNDASRAPRFAEFLGADVSGPDVLLKRRA